MHIPLRKLPHFLTTIKKKFVKKNKSHEALAVSTHSKSNTSVTSLFVIVRRLVLVLAKIV